MNLKDSFNVPDEKEGQLSFKIAWGSIILGLVLAILMVWGFIELGQNTTEMLNADLIH